MTARYVFELAMSLLDEINDDGTVNSGDTISYSAKAPGLISVLQRELAHIEGIQLTASITSLSDELEISDDTAERVMPYGLAAKFALSDNIEEFIDKYTAEYFRLKRTIRSDEEDITDVYDILAGMQ